MVGERLETIAFFGYGRFGQALGGRLQEAGLDIAAYDPGDAPPDEIAAQSPAELVAGAEHVILAVPVPPPARPSANCAPICDPTIC